MNELNEKSCIRLGKITYRELISFMDCSNNNNSTILEYFIEFSFNKFNLEKYIVKEDSKKYLYVKEDKINQYYEIYIDKKVFISDEIILKDIKKIISKK